MDKNGEKVWLGDICYMIEDLENLSFDQSALSREGSTWVEFQGIKILLGNTTDDCTLEAGGKRLVIDTATIAFVKEREFKKLQALKLKGMTHDMTQEVPTRSLEIDFPDTENLALCEGKEAKQIFNKYLAVHRKKRKKEAAQTNTRGM